MTKTIKLFTALMMILVLTSFTDKDAVPFVGTYGVGDSDPSQIKLVINSDHSFYYQDFSVYDKKVRVNGNWTLEGKKVVLNALGSAKKFHHLWTFEKNGLVAKSRKGLTFYRLMKINV